jgi:hypothetical protein
VKRFELHGIEVRWIAENEKQDRTNGKLSQDTIGGMTVRNIGKIIWKSLILFVISIDRTPADSFAA